MTEDKNHRQTSLRRRQDEREALLARIEAELRAEERVVAAWLAGSLGRGDADALSDIDLWVIVRDDAIAAIAADPRGFVAGIAEPCLVIDEPQNAPCGGAYLFTHISGETGAHQVDWYWQAASRAARPPATRLLFERSPVPEAPPPEPLGPNELRVRLEEQAILFWATVLLAAKSIARGSHRSVHRRLTSLDRLERTLRWLLDHGAEPSFEDLRVSRLPEVLPVSAAEELQLLDALVARCEAMEPDVERRGAALPIEGKRQVLRWLNFIRSTMA